MTWTVRLEPIGVTATLADGQPLIEALVDHGLHVLQECGRRGMCATCHVYIEQGMAQLSPKNRREERTLAVVTTAQPHSRLACQTKVLGNGVVVRVPQGMYLDVMEDIEALIGRRTEQDLVHPITGEVLVETGKLITRSIVDQLRATRIQVSEYLRQTREASFSD
ncbi:MAG: 2Fe-2S iron-sulfur cluster-binding protein [Gloeomargarita sp. SKYG116]|nr:2Fe-2S iron-sulfur cluster-binding protein [Gloeomargarita sp. SKYG116]MDW8402151.1 2Fe-2S iron-sulfur cluster-binding protein [Gloeomargarita sp. SKYGB_i_bin116]